MSDQAIETTAEETPSTRLLPGRMFTGRYTDPKDHLEKDGYKLISTETHERMHQALALAAQHRYGSIPCEVCGELAVSINGTIDTAEVADLISTMAEMVPDDESPFALPVQPHRRNLYPSLPPGWDGMTFETLTIDAGNADMVTVAQAWAEVPGGVLCLYGATGVGKTHLASAITQSCQAGGYDVSAWEFDHWHDTLRGVFDSGREEIEAFSHRMIRCGLLVWDDIRAEHTSQAAREMVEKIVNRRTQEGKPILITTNANEEEWTTWSARAYSRLRAKAYATWLPMVDRDRRLVA